MSRYFIFLCCLLLFTPALGAIEMSGGWSVSSDGESVSSGSSGVSSVSGDPTLVIGILSSTSLYGPGSVKLVREGSIEREITSGGFVLSAGFDGSVESEVILESSGTASAAAFIGATACAMPTGGGSHEIFGTADVTTEGMLVGKGSVTSKASGEASYGVSLQSGTTEVWGEVEGSSSTSLQGSAADSLLSTSGRKNGLHTESRVLSNRRNELTDSSTSILSAYATAMNSATADVTVSGRAVSGGWDSTSTTKSKLENENVASSASGTLKGKVIAPGNGDAASVIASVESTATRNTALYTGLPIGLYVSGGPSSYASASQSSSSTESYAQALIDPLWGSVARQPGRTALEWGSIETTGSGAIARESGAYALSFAKIQLTTDLVERSGISSSSGNITLATSTEISGDRKAVAGAIAHGVGYGDMWTSDGYMHNFASYVGDAETPIHHYSYVSSGDIVRGEISNIAKNVVISQDPSGTAILAKPFETNTKTKPVYYAWSSTEGWYYQAH
ncbi:hypothetical protein [Methanothrix thermoacetophila]|uniref:Uncharacterized protein n=1 Tax=Methanothrix thermoacetophila (strain DSM 6194 / JCM 14653 / NBRC 101360 / PT) TaxID=349307 RepID=A0B830_METTP|nr:hypothetical protein [Methanothrix thermoacetophila]ABK14854.1 hypothetical protein Mthe_1070 [Methanothrix thermoacetophila PT]